MTDLGLLLLARARAAIARHLGLTAAGTATLSDDAPALHQPGASFVTLTMNGRLRGCIGSLAAWRPLDEDVEDNAQAAAFRDPRFSPVTVTDYPALRIEVSRLSAPLPLSFATPDDALAQLRPGIDGVILTAGRHRATFLPQVWEQLPRPADFIAQLKLKAGLPAHAWPNDLGIERYEVEKWQEISS